MITQRLLHPVRMLHGHHNPAIGGPRTDLRRVFLAALLLALLAAALVWLMGGGIAGGHASAQDPVTMYEDPEPPICLSAGMT